jgi:hypothetical protein
VVQRKRHPRGSAPLDLDTYCALDHVLVSTSGGSFHGFMASWTSIRTRWDASAG